MKSKDFIPDGEANHLIPVHINTARDDNYFYHWSSDAKGWFKGDMIPDLLNRCYKKGRNTENYYK